METACDLKKRKRPSSSVLLAPLFNLFTRSSEAHVDPRRKIPRRGLLPDAGDDGSYHVSIKDLRSRRVFSPSPKPKSTGFGQDCGEGEFEKPDTPCGDEGEARKDDVDAALSSIIRQYRSEKDGGSNLYKDDDDETSEDGGMEKADLKAERGGMNNGEDDQIPSDSPKKDAPATEATKGLDGSDDDCIQTTPPEATDVILSPQPEEIGGNWDLHRADRLSVEPPQENSGDEGSGAGISKRNNFALKGEPGLNPRFRLRRRIYKRPGSISYRRLLPYLADMATEDPRSTRASGSQKHEKGMEAKPPHASISSSYKDIPVDESSKHRSDKPAAETVPLVMPTIDMPHDLQKNILHPDTPAIVNKGLGTRVIDGQIDSGKPELIMQGSTLCVDNKVGTHADVGKEKGEAEGTSCRLSGVADDLKSVKSVSSFFDVESIVDQCLNEEKHPMDGGMKRSQLISPPISGSRENGYSLFAETRGSDHGEVVNQMTDTNEARLLYFSSDSGVCGEAGVNEIEGDKNNFVKASANGVLENSPSNTSKACYSGLDKNNRNSTQSKMVLNPCSRLKVYKNPNSFSYKRMLPYLMEIAKDESGTPENGQCLNLLIRSKEEIPSPPMLSGSQKFPTDKCNDDCGSADHNISSPELVAHGTCLQKDEDTLGKHVIPSADSEHKSSYGIVSTRDEGHPQAASPYPIAVCQSKEGFNTMLCQPSKCVGEFSANSTPELSSDAEEIGAEGAMRNFSQVGSSDLSGFPDEASRRGILKRNPRGCRGLCSCLICASFRLNAERAFEFSRNQMKDAEEMTSNLIKQLSQLRSIVEKINCGVSNLAVLEESQVRDACRRASEAEEITKHRLSEMNDELNIHSRVVRLYRPRVTFNDSTRIGTLHEELDSKGF